MFIRKDVYRVSCVVRRITDNDSRFTTNDQRPQGFTLLELLITLAVIAIISVISSSPAMDLWNAQKTFTNTFNSLQGELSSLRNQAMTQSTTTRMVLTSNAGVYTINTYYSSTPVVTCTAAAATWTAIETNKNLKVNSRYQITGSGMNDTCFYRDGSSSGGTYVIAPITATTGLKTATITATMATGYLDVVVQ